MSDTRISGKPAKPGRVPPKIVILGAWKAHRAILRLTGGRRGLWVATPTTWGTLRLTTVGRKSGKRREAIVGYFEDGENLVTLAMNGWMAPEPAWWLNLQAQPDVVVELKDGVRDVHAREAVGDERERLMDVWRTYGDYDAFAAKRPNPTAVVVLEPRS